MMTLYSGTTCPFSQRCRIVLYEKGMDFQIVDVDLFNKPEDLAVMNPYNQVPVLVERDLILYESNIINEYIDDRFPHPQLMPADPVMRARARLFLYRFENEMFCHIHSVEKGTQRQAEKGRQVIRDALTQIAPVFAKQKFMLGDEFSMLDVAIAPLLVTWSGYGERTVILSERQGQMNNPAYLLYEEVLGTAFRAHPYRHTVIGHEADLRRILAITLQRVPPDAHADRRAEHVQDPRPLPLLVT